MKRANFSFTIWEKKPTENFTFAKVLHVCVYKRDRGSSEIQADFPMPSMVGARPGTKTTKSIQNLFLNEEYIYLVKCKLFIRSSFLLLIYNLRDRKSSHLLVHSLNDHNGVAGLQQFGR